MVEILAAFIIACSNISTFRNDKSMCIVRVTNCYNEYVKEHPLSGVPSGFNKECAKEVK